MKASRRGKSKSVLRIKEPSLIIPKPHRVDHILKSCFKDAYGQTREDCFATETALTQHRTVDAEKMATEDEVIVALRQKIEMYSQLENHLQQAKAKAITEEEIHLSQMKEQFPLCDNDIIMKQTYPISTYLNESLLKEQGLLFLSECLPAPAPTASIPPRETIPSYLNSTVTSEQHARFKTSDIANGEIKKQKEEEDDSKSVPFWKNSLSSEERQREKTALLELQRKTTFLHNPRQSAHKHSNTASNGPVKLKKGKKEKEKDTNLFIAEPPELVFTDYSPGNSYEQFIDFKNISGASRQLRIVPPKSTHFKVKIAHFPNAEGIIAPGMSCCYSVQFIPDTLTDYDDIIKVITHNGDCLVVPLKGYRPPPQLSVPLILECGHCLVGNTISITFPCINNGGEGNFKLVMVDNLQKQDCNDNILILDSFIISPTVFHLLPEASIDIKVEFHPLKAQLYISEFLMICDNGQVNTFTIQGTGDMLSIACVYVTPSADSINTAIKYAESAGHTPSIDIVDYNSETVSSNSLIEFDYTNPCVSLYKTVVIRNYSGVRLSYQWGYYHPRTELSSTGNASELVETTNSSFSLEGGEGKEMNVILPGETKLVSLLYTPLKTGENHVMAYMELNEIPLSSLRPDGEEWSWTKLDSNRISPLYLELKGYADPYNIELCPPLVCLIEGLPPLTDKKQTLKIINHSISTVSFEWTNIHNRHCTVSVEPSTGAIVSNGCQYCECIIKATDIPGQYSVPIECNIINSNSDPITLLIKGYTQYPIVSVSSPSIELGLIQLGHSVSRSLTLTNESNSTASYTLKQIITETLTDTVDYQCLCFTPDHGDIPPLSSVTVQIVCCPMVDCGRLRSAIELCINGKKNSMIPASAEIQRPSLVLEQASVYLDSCYVGIPYTQQIMIINRGLLPTKYEWIDKNKFDYCQLEFSPSKGAIGPKETISIDFTSTWNTEGYHTSVLAICKVEAMNEPLLLSVSSRVMGLSIHYSLNQTDTNHHDLVLDYGSSNPVGIPKELYITITNTSAINATLSMNVQHFKPQQQQQQQQQQQLNSIRTNTTTTNNSGSLLCATENIVNPFTKTNKQKESDVSEWLLSDGRGCCFTLTSSRCDLPPFQSQLIKVVAYSDMWGQYTDQLVCKVDGIEPRYIPINYGVIGSPILFQTTATYGETVVRFGSQPARAKVLKRKLKLVNTSSSNIRIDWRVFNHCPDDNKLIDLITFVGEPFPIITETECANRTDLSSPLVRAIIQPHDGVLSSGYPFIIDQQQMVINSKSSSTITIQFDPSIVSYNELGEHINSYILGYCSLDEKCPVGCVRQCGYNVAPLRINITGTIQHSKLIIESDDFDNNSLIFSHMASELINKDKDNNVAVLDSVSIKHNFNIVNPTDAILTFKVAQLLLPYTLHLENQGDNTLKPRQKITAEIEYCIDHSTVVQQKTDTLLLSTNNIIIQFNTGAIQKFPVVTKIHLPQLSIYPALLDYGAVHLSHSHTAGVQLMNESHSFCAWNVSVPQEYHDVVVISPTEGVLGTANNETTQSWVTTLNVTFTPKSELEHLVTIIIRETLTQTCVVLTIKGNGSVDESIKTMKKKRTKQ